MKILERAFEKYLNFFYIQFMMTLQFLEDELNGNEPFRYVFRP